MFEPWTLLHLDAIPDAWRQLEEWNQTVEGERFTTEGPVNAVYLDDAWIPIAYDGGGNHLCLDTAPAEGGQNGQVVVFVHDDSVREVLAPSLAAWMEALARALDSDRKPVAEENPFLPDAMGHARFERRLREPYAPLDTSPFEDWLEWRRLATRCPRRASTAMRVPTPWCRWERAASVSRSAL